MKAEIKEEKNDALNDERLMEIADWRLNYKSSLVEGVLTQHYDGDPQQVVDFARQVLLESKPVAIQTPTGENDTVPVDNAQLIKELQEIRSNGWIINLNARLKHFQSVPNSELRKEVCLFITKIDQALLAYQHRETKNGDTILRVQKALGFTTKGYVDPDFIISRINRSVSGAPTGEK